MRYLASVGVGLVSFGVLASVELATDYGEQRTLSLHAESTLSLETTQFEMLVDGEPMDHGRRGGGEGSSEAAREVSWSDTNLEHQEGTPTKVKRVYGSVALNDQTGSGGRQFNDEREGPHSSLVLELSVDDMEGFLLFSMDAKHPTKLVLEGTLSTEQSTTRDRGERSMPSVN